MRTWDTCLTMDRSPPICATASTNRLCDSFPMRKTLLTVLLSAALMPAQTESPVVGVGPFLHMVSDLDQSLAFYRDKLGLELTGPAGEHKFTDNPAVANLYGVPGKQFRAAVLKIPGSAMGIELVQWGEAQKLKHGPIVDPGTVTLIL